MVGRKTSVGCLGIVLVAVGYVQAAREPLATPAPVRMYGAQAQTVSTSGPQDSRTAVAADAVSAKQLINKYCMTCHRGPNARGGLALDTADVDNVGKGAEMWEKVVRKLRAGVMPPDGMPRPDRPAKTAFIGWLEGALDAAAATAPNHGRPMLHRLNRVEYTNAIRDLLAVEVDGKSLLPGDDSSYGFDNIADVLKVSPGLLDRYLLAAEKIARLAVGDPTLRPATATYALPFGLFQDDRMSEDLPFGSRGGVAIRHHFPLDGEYAISVRLQRSELNAGHGLRGLDVPNAIDIRIDGTRVGLFNLARRSGDRRAARKDDDDGLEVGDDADAVLNVRVPVKAGLRTLGVVFNKSTWYVEGVGASRFPSGSNAYTSGRVTAQNYGKIEAGVDHVDIAGPFGVVAPGDTPSRRQLFVCRPARAEDEEPCARRIVSTLARRAYRRPVTDADVETLLGFYKDGRSDGDFDRGIQRALERVLAAPDFLFRVERGPADVTAGSIYRVSDFELASELSFFLWSSIPDDELLDLAARDRLKDRSVMEGQVRRMLGDPRSKAFVENFFGQWLYVRNMQAVKPDVVTFPEFDDNLREAFQTETQLFLESQLREDRGTTELLTANYTFVNERLARHYGIPNVSGNHFRRITLSDGRRGGILGQGSLLTVTSYANRTSPVSRGKWILENLLGTPPPPPPPDVPSLEDDKASQAVSMRARMEQHRKNPVCAACHSKMDPLGFALENFDGIGKWRNRDGTTSVDASGALPDGTTFDGPAAFRQALLSHREDFMLTLTEKLLTYALGRGVEYYDLPAVRAIVREAASKDNRWSSLIASIVMSSPFQMRRSES